MQTPGLSCRCQISLCVQVEILRRLRLDSENLMLRDALMLTINGLASGMRNTG